MKKFIMLLMMLFPIILVGITLEEAEHYVLTNSKQIKIAEAERLGTVASYNSVRGNLYPQLTLMGSYGVQSTDFPEFVPKSSRIPEKELPLNTVLKMQQLLWSGDVFSGLRAAEVAEKINESKYDLTKLKLQYGVKKAYNAALLSKEVVSINREAMQIANSHYSQVKLMYSEGLVSEFDKLRAELSVSQIEPKLQEAENNYRLSLKALENILGGTLEISDVEGKFEHPNITTYELAELIELAIDNRLEVYLAELGSDIYEIQYKNQTRKIIPTLALTGQITNYTVTNDYSVDSDNFGNQYKLSLDFTVPLFTGFSNKNKAKNYHYQMISSRLKSEKLLDDIELEVTKYYISLKKDKKNLLLAEKNRTLAVKALTIAETRFRNNLGTQLDIQDAQLSYNQTQLQYVKAIYDIITDYDNLLESIGMEYNKEGEIENEK